LHAGTPSSFGVGALTALIVLGTADDGSSWIEVDGDRDRDLGLRWVDQLGMPFVGVWAGDERMYDVEIWWSDGTFIGRVPEQSDIVDAVYDSIEGAPPPAPPRAPRAEDDDWGDRLNDLQEEMAEHPGLLILRAWKGLQRMLQVHDANGMDLQSILVRLREDPELAVEMFQNTRPPVIREQVEAAIDQRLHNYVASAVSLVDHSRRLLRRYEGTRLWAEYGRRRGAISAGGASLLIRGLRNYALHRELPFVGGTVTLSAESGASATMLLNSESLLEWDKWEAAARRFIENSGDTIDLHALVVEHTQLVDDLYRWLLAQADRLHRFEVELYNDLREEYNWTLTSGEHGRPRRFRAT
jgi:hypothetical protein